MTTIGGAAGARPGRRVVGLPAEPGSFLVRLVDAARTVAGTDMPPWALVGGLAVMVQLAEAHRATGDIDTAADDDHDQVSPALNVLLDVGARWDGPNRIYLEDNTRVDILRVGAVNPEDLPEPGDLNRMYALAHSWAVTTAVVTELIVLDARGHGQVLSEAVIPIATPGALVAMKLQSLRRRDRLEEKRASDVYDIYRLLLDHDRDGAVAQVLAASPEDVGPWCAAALEETFTVDAAAWARRLGVHASGAAMSTVSAEDLDVVGSLCAEHLRRLLS